MPGTTWWPSLTDLPGNCSSSLTAASTASSPRPAPLATEAKGRRFGYLGVESNASEQGGAKGSTNWFDGEIDDVRFYAAATTPEEITSIFNEDPSDAADALRTPADRDGDGIFNRWETQYGLDPDNPSDADTPTTDAEGVANGVTYLEQFRAGADPTVDNDYVEPMETPVVTVAAVDAERLRTGGRNRYSADQRYPAPRATFPSTFHSGPAPTPEWANPIPPIMK